MPDMTKYLLGMGILPSVASGEKSSSSLIYTGKCLLTGIKIVTNGTNEATAIIYDNTSGSGKIVDKFVVAGDENYGGAIYGKAPLIMENGIYVSITGTGAKFYCSYFNGDISFLGEEWSAWE